MEINVNGKISCSVEEKITEIMSEYIETEDFKKAVISRIHEIFGGQMESDFFKNAIEDIFKQSIIDEIQNVIEEKIDFDSVNEKTLEPLREKVCELIDELDK